jgi:hypothetical protein
MRRGGRQAEVAILDAIRQQKTNFDTLDDAISFLSTSDLKKSPYSRVIAWLFVFELIPAPPAEPAPAIHELVESYKRLSRSRVPKSDPRKSPFLTSDFDTANNWMLAQYTHFHLPPSFKDNLLRYPQRILGILSQNGFPYSVGFDRYILVIYLLCLTFAAAIEVSDTAAEALAYHLSRQFLELINLSQYLNDDATFVIDIERRLRDQFPQIQKTLTNHHEWKSLVKTWKVTLFQTQHSVTEIWFLWDFLLVRKDDYAAGLDGLCVGHLAQGNAEAADFVGELKAKREWNVAEIVRAGRDREGPPKRAGVPYVQIYNTVVAIVVALAMWFFSRGRFQSS